MMGTMAQQLLGFFLGLLGLVGTLTSTVLPHWRQTAYFSTNFITASYYMKGLWMECVSHTAGIYQCEFHRSMLSLPKDLLAARILMVLSCTTSILAAILSAVGMKCTRCAYQCHAKGSIAVTGGSCFVLAGLFCLITTSWTTCDVIRDAYNPFSTSGMKYEIGLAVYISFSSAIFSICGGGMLCVASWDVRNYLSHKVADPQVPGPNKCHIPAYQANTAFESDHSSSPNFSSSSAYRLSDSISESSIKSKT
ncbi:claudin-14-like [Pangasianodon hypophthalmus]|uniref:claudin-14-like n=1 Tax=Pangasianodon hypophthalmus TaxID=310915 RepID=UPI000EFFD8E7|nr:claudin-14-like [Pangasianodon hypophthalmus]XP_026802935.1 claudin-14-like [Pangasianodon hypophthalmus]XP_034160212.1 claudin-14-like [Pangasianodon hypophthalmus]